MGDDQVLEMIQAGKNEKEITESWQEELNGYKKMRSKYTIYK